MCQQCAVVVDDDVMDRWMYTTSVCLRHYSPNHKVYPSWWTFITRSKTQEPWMNIARQQYLYRSSNQSTHAFIMKHSHLHVFFQP